MVVSACFSLSEDHRFNVLGRTPVHQSVEELAVPLLHHSSPLRKASHFQRWVGLGVASRFLRLSFLCRCERRGIRLLVNDLVVGCCRRALRARARPAGLRVCQDDISHVVHPPIILIFDDAVPSPTRLPLLCPLAHESVGLKVDVLLQCGIESIRDDSLGQEIKLCPPLGIRSLRELEFVPEEVKSAAVSAFEASRAIPLAYLSCGEKNHPFPSPDLPIRTQSNFVSFPQVRPLSLCCTKYWRESHTILKSARRGWRPTKSVVIDESLRRLIAFAMSRAARHAD